MASTVALHAVLALAVVAGTLCSLSLAGAPAPADPAQALRAAMDGGALQSYFPEEEPRARTPETPPVAIVQLRKPEREARHSMTAQLLALLAWMAGFTVFGIMAQQLRQYLPTWEVLEHDVAAGPPAQTSARPDQRHPIDVADGMVSNGQMAEAMHYLLVLALAHVAARAGKPLPASLTSREVLRHLRLPTLEQASLRLFVEFVERVWFGLHRASQHDYDACKAIFLRLVPPSDAMP